MQVVFQMAGAATANQRQESKHVLQCSYSVTYRDWCVVRAVFRGVHNMIGSCAGVHDISRLGAAGRAAHTDDNRLRTHCCEAGAGISSAQRQQQRFQTLVLYHSQPNQ